MSGLRWVVPKEAAVCEPPLVWRGGGGGSGGVEDEEALLNVES